MIKSKKDNSIKQLRQCQEEAMTRQLKNIVTLFQEFEDVIKSLEKTEDKISIWSNELKFYNKD